MDARALEAINLLSKLSINHLSPEWIKEIIDADFTEVPDLPYEFDEFHASTNFVGLFNGIKNILRQWIDAIPANGEDQNVSQERRLSFSFLSTSSMCNEDLEKRDVYSHFWVKMTKTFNINGLLSLLFYYIHTGQRYDATEEARELGILAAGLYYLLLSIPGSNAFRVFHPILYLKALDILRLTTKLNIGASPKKGARGSKASRRRSDDLYGDNEDEDAEFAFLSPQEANKLIRLLNILLNDFLRLAQRFSLKHSPESLEETLSILVDVTRCETHNAYDIFVSRHGPASATALAYNAYVGLQNICVQLHGNVKKTVTLIMKHLLNNILMISRGSSDLSTRALGVIREHTVVFVKYLLVQIKEVAYDGVYILLQHLCLQVPDKADFREKTAKSVVDILKALPLNWHTRFLKWLYKFSHNEKAGHRLFALEVILKLLTEEERLVTNESPIPRGEPERAACNLGLAAESVEDEAQGSPSENGVSSSITSVKSVPTDHSTEAPLDCNILSHKFLLSIIFSRCRDSAATVRAKALFLLAECSLSSNETIIQSMRDIFFKEKRPDIFATPHIDGNINCESPQIEEDSVSQIELPNAERILAMLRRRALDEKVTVRKSALLVLENLMKLNKGILSLKHVEVLVEHCRDPALLIRKQIISSLTNIVETYPEDEDVIKMWVKGIMPLILDPEIKVQERIIEVANGLLFTRIKPYGLMANSASHKLPFKILSAITDLSYHKFFSKILAMWSKSDLKKPMIIASVQTHIDHEYDEQAWMLLALLSQNLPIKDLKFALNYFEQYSNTPNVVGSYTLQQVLKVLSHGIAHIPHENAEQLKENLLNHIRNFSLSVELISSMIDAVTIITYNLEGDKEEGQNAIEDWALPILKHSDTFLKEKLFPKNAHTLTNGEEEALFRHIFTIGELSMLCPKVENKRLFLLMQSIIFHDTHATCHSPPHIPSTQTQSSQPPAVTFTPTRRLKSVAVVTLGKMCLQHENQAKRVVPALGKILETTALPELKNNVIFVLSDLCVRYATLVDPLMPQVTACLMDEDVQVRRTTLTLLINLLQEDYLKLKGSFFYRILQCLCDDHEDIKNTVNFFMTERLLKRFPKIFLQHFIECIFHYNCYEEHESYNRFVQSKKEKELFSLCGPEFREKRMFLYSFMLEHMSDEQRFSTTHRLCQDVLGGIVDGRIKLTPSSLPMIEDTLMVLSSEEIKLASLNSRPEDSDQPTDQAEQAAMAGQVIKKTLISKFVKNNVIENIVPILIALKQRLEEQKSPLMKQLLLYFKEIMKDYKNEIKEILAGDKQLAKEIEFDLRKLEQAQQKEEEEKCRQKEVQAQQECQETLEKQRQQTMDPTSGGNNQKRPLPSLGDSPKLRPPTDLPISAERESDEAPQDQPCMEGEDLKEGNREEDETSREGNGQENIPVSSSILRRKSDGTELLKKALFNSKKLDRRKSVCPSSLREGNQPDTNRGEMERQKQPEGEHPIRVVSSFDKSKIGHLKECSIVINRINCAATLMPPPPSPSPPNAESAGLSEASFQPLLSIPEEYTKDPPPTPLPEIHRKKLLRAISTPERYKVIDNITFINKSQEISCIRSDTSEISSKDDTDNSEKTMLLHFRSPEAFAKDEEFSKLKRCSKRSLAKEFSNPKSLLQDAKAKKGNRQANKTPVEGKRPSGGFMESFTSRHNDEGDEEDDSEFSELVKSCSKDRHEDETPQPFPSPAVVNRKRSKRTRDAASLSPLVSKTTSGSNPQSSPTKKVSPKRTKRKGKR